MQDEQLDDLKQFIEATVSQSEERIKDELRGEIKDAKNEIREEMQSGFEGVGEAIEQIDNVTTNHERRITKLERKIA